MTHERLVDGVHIEGHLHGKVEQRPLPGGERRFPIFGLDLIGECLIRELTEILPVGLRSVETPIGG